MVRHQDGHGVLVVTKPAKLSSATIRIGYLIRVQPLGIGYLPLNEVG